MNHYIYERVIDVAYYIIDTKETIREIASKFRVSKSTIHKDLIERLPQIDYILYNEVQSILDYHKRVRHIRGGEATKRKYSYKKNYTK